MIILNQKPNPLLVEMRWECDDITKVINEYYKVDREKWSYLMIFDITKDGNVYDDNSIITFAVRYPGKTIGCIKCDGIGRIIQADFYDEDCKDSYLNTVFKNLEGIHIDGTELSKIKFVYNNTSINGKANKQILWFIANFIYHQTSYTDAPKHISQQFRSGYCLHFAIILKTLFETGEICWAAPYGHMVYLHDGIPYDIEGINTSDCEYYIPISYLKKGIKDFIRIPGVYFNASEEYIQDIIKRFKEDNNLIK